MPPREALLRPPNPPCRSQAPLGNASREAPLRPSPLSKNPCRSQAPLGNDKNDKRWKNRGNLVIFPQGWTCPEKIAIISDFPIRQRGTQHVTSETTLNLNNAKPFDKKTLSAKNPRLREGEFRRGSIKMDGDNSCAFSNPTEQHVVVGRIKVHGVYVRAKHLSCRSYGFIGRRRNRSGVAVRRGKGLGGRLRLLEKRGARTYWPNQATSGTDGSASTRKDMLDFVGIDKRICGEGREDVEHVGKCADLLLHFNALGDPRPLFPRHATVPATGTSVNEANSTQKRGGQWGASCRMQMWLFDMERPAPPIPASKPKYSPVFPAVKAPTVRIPVRAVTQKRRNGALTCPPLSVRGNNGPRGTDLGRRAVGVDILSENIAVAHARLAKSLPSSKPRAQRAKKPRRVKSEALSLNRQSAFKGRKAA